MWVRGLKPIGHLFYPLEEMSHPMWVRGLKLAIVNDKGGVGKSHPMWVRGLKQFFVLTVQSYKLKPRIIVLASNIPI